MSPYAYSAVYNFVSFLSYCQASASASTASELDLSLSMGSSHASHLCGLSFLA
jgi:hypothetical protein